MNENVVSLKASTPLSPLQLNARDMAADLAWCEQVIETRIALYFEQQTPHSSVFALEPPDINAHARSAYAEFVQQHKLDFADRLTLLLALLPAVKPRLLDVFLCHNELSNRPYTEFGCVEIDGSVYATGETLAFILGADDLATRLQVQAHLQSSDKSGIHQVLGLQSSQNDPLLMKTPLQLSHEYQHRFTTAQPYRPDLSADFPASYIRVDLDWADLILPPDVMSQLEEIKGWITHGETLLNEWGMAEKIRPGYRALFHGPPGTGKTLTAGLLGQSTGRDVYKIDLSMVVSKYIGETEKNLEKVFALAEDKSWILFFDEADALFGKRTEASGANDQFANQNVSYLLQRIERFNGIAILASNFKDNFDDAFFRRFESMIYFELPGVKERLNLWQRGFSPKAVLDKSIDLAVIAEEHVLSGAEIINVIRFVSLKALCGGRNEISLEDIDEGIVRAQGDGRNGDGPSPHVEAHGVDIFG